MDCRPNCGACCIFLSISLVIPGMPKGKPASVKCTQLDGNLNCRIFNSPDWPKVSSGFNAEKIISGNSSQVAYSIIASLKVYLFN